MSKLFEKVQDRLAEVWRAVKRGAKKQYYGVEEESEEDCFDPVVDHWKAISEEEFPESVQDDIEKMRFYARMARPARTATGLCMEERLKQEHTPIPPESKPILDSFKQVEGKAGDWWRRQEVLEVIGDFLTEHEGSVLTSHLIEEALREARETSDMQS